MKYLIAGLGNIGPQYEHTRHNIGFDVLDFWARESGETFTLGKHAQVSLVTFKGKQIVLIKPTTYMNLSGKAVKFWMNELKIPIEQVLIVMDDLALPFGTLRLRGKGSDGGHNGLKSIDFELQRNDYARLRFGIGSEFSKGKQVDFVLGKWPQNQEIELQEKIEKAVEICKSFCTAGLANTMTQFNNK